ncbi:MAG: GxxExxY protein [Syntrophobacteraceae bacterium]|jgi:GxxExxY protein
MQDAALTDEIIGCAIRVHRALGPGFLESVYVKALAHELCKAGLQAECQRTVKVVYDGVVVGDFVADMLIADAVLVESKAVSALVQAHEVQLVNYLTATGIEIGLLLNFGATSLQVKRKYRTYREKGMSNPVNPVQVLENGVFK